MGMNHFYDMSSSDFSKLKAMMRNILGEYVLESSSGVVPELTLSDFSGKKQRVLIFFTGSDYSPYFQGSQMISPWPASTSPAYTTQYLTENLERGRPDTPQFYVHQCTMTEDGKIIA